MSRHTEGPWVIKVPDHEGAVPSAVQAITWSGKVTVCAFPWTLRRQAGAIPFGTSQSISSTWYANAAVISAAPDLLLACWTALYHISADASIEASEKREGNATKAMKELRKAIDKAEGR
jgi:hypothetical protein